MKESGLSRKERITKQLELRETRLRGRALMSKGLKIFYRPNGLPFCRMAVFINRKFGNACERNRAKRHIRELFRRNKTLLPPGKDIIFYIREEFGNYAFEEKKKCFLELTNRIV